MHMESHIMYSMDGALALSCHSHDGLRLAAYTVILLSRTKLSAIAHTRTVIHDYRTQVRHNIVCVDKNRLSKQNNRENERFGTERVHKRKNGICFNVLDLILAQF